MTLQKLIKNLWLVLLFLLFCYPLALHTSYAEEPMYQISGEQLTNLNNIINRQESRLETLQKKLEVLQMNSTEQIQELTESQSQLLELKNQLNETRQKLKNANEFLAMAKQTLAKQEESLNLLDAQIKAMEHKNTVLKRQRLMWQAISVISISGLIHKQFT